MALTEKERVALQLDAWKKVVEVQQHFNDMEMRVRSLCLTVLGTIFGAAAYFSAQDKSTAILGFSAPVSVYLLWLAVGVVLLFWLMDGGWYHYFLRGAVSTGQTLEDYLGPFVPGVNLTASISRSSHAYILGRQITSATRAAVFYGTLALFAYSFAVLSHVPVNIYWHALVVLAVWIGLLAVSLFTGMRTAREITVTTCKVCGAGINEKQHCGACDRQESVPPRQLSWFRVAGRILITIIGFALFFSQWGFDPLAFSSWLHAPLVWLHTPLVWLHIAR